MKKNLVTKTLLLSALFSAVLLAGCNQNAEPSAVEEITVASVVPETKSEEAVPVTQKVFEDVVMDNLASELPKLVSAIAPVANKTSNTKSREAVTIDALQESFKDFKNSFKIELAEDGTSGYIKGAWNGPLGELDYGDSVKGLSTTIDALRVSADASFNTTVTGISGKANGSARYSASSKFALPSADVDSSIKSGKANVLYYLNVNNVNASVSADKIEAIMSLDVEDPEDLAAAVDVLNTLAGSINFYAGIDTALYFEVEDKNQLYNGVIKANVSAVINYGLSKDTLKATLNALAELVEKIDNDEDITAEDLAPLNSLVTLNIDLSVYDTTGNEIFSIIKATKLDEAYTKINALFEDSSKQ